MIIFEKHKGLKYKKRFYVNFPKNINDTSEETKKIRVLI